VLSRALADLCGRNDRPASTSVERTIQASVTPRNLTSVLEMIEDLDRSANAKLNGMTIRFIDRCAGPA
jgi:hypothetical protein